MVASILCIALGVLAVGTIAGPAVAEQLDLPPGAIMIVRSRPEHIRPHSLSPRQERSRSELPSGLDLPKGSIVLELAARPPPFLGEASGDRETPPTVAVAIHDSAIRHGLSPALVEAVAWQESRFDHQRVSPKGAIGIMQLMPTTAAELGVDPSDLRDNIEGGATYLSNLVRRFSGDVRLALAAYNAGPSAVERFGGVPPYAETQDYVVAVLHRLGRKGASAQ